MVVPDLFDYWNLNSTVIMVGFELMPLSQWSRTLDVSKSSNLAVTTLLQRYNWLLSLSLGRAEILNSLFPLPIYGLELGVVWNLNFRFIPRKRKLVKL